MQIYLNPKQAAELFPLHSLPVPPTLPEIPFFSGYEGWSKYPQKTLQIPKGWENSLDGFSSLVDQLPIPKRVTVIGFGEGKELICLTQKWPQTQIIGFEQQDEGKDFKAYPNITVSYNGHPYSYTHTGDLVDLVIIRHPNTLTIPIWCSLVCHALDALSENGVLLVTFYSKKEVVALREAFKKAPITGFVWTDRINPVAYNPAFVSKKGDNSFDLFMATITRIHRPKLTFTQAKIRQNEISPVQPHYSLQRYRVIHHPSSVMITRPDHAEMHSKETFAQEKLCFVCHEKSIDYFRTTAYFGGRSGDQGGVDFCHDHIPAHAKAWERVLKAAWKDDSLFSLKFEPIGISFKHALPAAKI